MAKCRTDGPGRAAPQTTWREPRQPRRGEAAGLYLGLLRSNAEFPGPAARIRTFPTSAVDHPAHHPLASDLKPLSDPPTDH